MNDVGILFDLDGVICKTKGNSYHLSKPNKQSIKKVNELYQKGNYIKIFTARFMGRSKENKSAAIKKGFILTKKQLMNWAFLKPFHSTKMPSRLHKQKTKGLRKY